MEFDPTDKSKNVWRRTIGRPPPAKHRTISLVCYFSVYEYFMFVLSSKNTGIKFLAIYFLIF